MRNILFVVGNCSFGGTTSSLKNFLDVIPNELKQEISVFALESKGISDTCFKDCAQIQPINLFDLWFGNFSEMSFAKKIIAFPIKLIRGISNSFHLNFEGWLYKRVAKYPFFSGYSKVIAFSEGPATRFASFINSKEHIAWVHCNYRYSVYKPQYESKYYTKYNRIICVSKFTAQVFQSLFSSVSQRVEYLYNVINYKKILELSIQQDPLFSDISEKEFIIVSIGRIDPIKGFTHIPKICNEIRQQTTRKFRWIIVGSGNNSELSKIQEQIHYYNVENIVRLAGYKSNPFPILKKANLYVCTSISEACPMVFLEANSLEKFIISTNFPSAIEFLSKDRLAGVVTEIDKMSEIIFSFMQSHENLEVKVNRLFVQEATQKFIGLLNYE